MKCFFKFELIYYNLFKFIFYCYRIYIIACDLRKVRVLSTPTRNLLYSLDFQTHS